MSRGINLMLRVWLEEVDDFFVERFFFQREEAIVCVTAVLQESSAA